MSPLAPSIAAYRAGTVSFETLMEHAASRSLLDSRSLGAVYTPSWVVAAILDHLAPQHHDTILDPAVGRGAFLIPLLERTTATMTAQEAYDWMCAHTLAVDIDPTALADLDAIIRAWYWRRWRFVLPGGDLPNLRLGNSLKDPLPACTIALGNPPYIRIQSLDPAMRQWLQAHYTSCALGNVDLYYAFIELALRTAQKVGFIVPNSFLTTRSGAALRHMLDGRVSHIVDYGSRRVFPGVGTYTCLLFAQAHATNATITSAATGQTRPFSPTTTRPTPARAVLGGIATLCDKAYAVVREGDQFTAVLTGMPVEAGIVRPLIKATKFRGSTQDWTSFVIHPYANGALLDPTQLAAFPQALAHLNAVRPLLDARDRGKTDRYPEWYAYGRAQGLTPLQGPQALIVPAMMGGQSQPRLTDISPLLHWGAPLLTSGYGVDAPTPTDIEALLSARFWDTVRTHGAAKPGKDEEYHSVASWMVKGQT